MQQRGKFAHIGALIDKFRRQTHRQIGGQSQRIEIELRARVIRRQRTDVGSQKIPLLGQLGAQRRQIGKRALQEGLLLQDIGARGAACRKAALGDLKLFLL